MAETDRTPRTEAEIAAWVAKTHAEARLISLQADRAESERDISRSMAAGATIAAARETRKHETELATDAEHRILRYFGAIKPAVSVYVITTFDEWRRLDAQAGQHDRPYEFHLTSSGGEIESGLAIYDYLRAMDAQHPLTTVAAGQCASMATVLIQAGSTRISYPSTSWLIHRAAWQAFGREDEIEDQAAHVKLIQDRIFEILASKAVVSAKDLRTKSQRKDWWFLGAEALAMGLVDRMI